MTLYELRQTNPQRMLRRPPQGDWRGFRNRESLETVCSTRLGYTWAHCQIELKPLKNGLISLTVRPGSPGVRPFVPGWLEPEGD